MYTLLYLAVKVNGVFLFSVFQELRAKRFAQKR